MGSLDVQWRWEAAASAGTGFARGNVWSRRARRKQARPDEAGSGSGTTITASQSASIAADDAAALGFRVCVRRRSHETTEVIVRWVKGLDHVVFESFCGMLKRKIQERCYVRGESG